MKRLTILLATLTALFALGRAPVFAQHGGGHGGGLGPAPNTGPGVDEGRGRNAGPNSKIGNPNQSSNPMSKAPEEALADNKNLASRLQALLPAGVNVQDAAKGFKNLGEFVAAVHVSHNLDIPLDSLKSSVMAGDSLGKAIHALKPEANAKEEAKRAHKQAKATIEEANS